MEILNIISENFVVFMILIAILIINFCCIIYLIFRERKSDNEEIKEILQDLNSKEEKVELKLEEKQDQKMEENKKEVEEMLLKMQQDLETKPEDVVSHFENEQEEKSIISYQELLDSVRKNNNNVKVTPVAIDDSEKIEVDIDDTQKINIDDTQKINIEPTEDIQKINIEDTQRIDINEFEYAAPVKEEIGEKKFKGTDFISPIFGRQENNVKYPTVPKRITAINNLVDEKDKKYDTILNNSISVKKIDEDIRKNDEFLKALKEFRKNLD